MDLEAYAKSLNNYGTPPIGEEYTAAKALLDVPSAYAHATQSHPIEVFKTFMEHFDTITGDFEADYQLLRACSAHRTQFNEPVPNDCTAAILFSLFCSMLKVIKDTGISLEGLLALFNSNLIWEMFACFGRDYAADGPVFTASTLRDILEL